MTTQITTLEQAGPEELTMTSLELLEVINKYREEDSKGPMSHNNFIQKIRDEFEGGELKFQSSYLSKQNKELLCYLLPEDECKILAMRESKFVRRRTMDYIKSLESKNTEVVKLPNFNDPAEAARAWAKEYEQKTLALVELSEVKDYSNRQTKYIDVLEKQHASGITIPMFCKALHGTNTQQIQNFLSTQKNWMHKQGGSWVASAYSRDKYLSVALKPDHMGVDRPVCYLTERGATLLYKYYCKQELPMKRDWNGDLTPQKYLPIIGTDED